MEEKNLEGINIKKLFHALEDMLQSLKGKYTMETYIEVLGEFTDSIIKDSKKEGLKFTGGYVTFKYKVDYIEAEIKMYFMAYDGTRKLKEAKRNLNCNIFMNRTIDEIKKAEGGLQFAIEESEEEC